MTRAYEIGQRVLQVAPAIIIVAVLLVAYRSCAAPAPAFEPLTAPHRLMVMPDTIFLGQTEVKITDGVCAKKGNHDATAIEITLTIQRDPPIAGGSYVLFEKAPLTLRAGECSETSVTALSRRPFDGFQSGFYRLSAMFNTTGANGERQTITLTSNRFQVIVP